MENFIKEIDLIGQENFDKLQESSVIIFGLGGVGGFVCESLARSGIKKFTLVDFDTIEYSNINRQIIANENNIGHFKTEEMKRRICEINHEAEVQCLNINVNADNIDEIDFSSFDYIVDAIDTVTSKILIIQKAKEFNCKIISSMGTGNKLDPTRLLIDDISKTSICPLAKVMRKELRDRNIEKVPVLFSTEPPIKPKDFYGYLK